MAVEPGRDISKRIILAEGIERRSVTAQDRAALAATKAWRAIEGFLERTAAVGRPGEYTDADEPKFFDHLGGAAHAAVREGDHVNYSTLARWGRIGTRKTVKTYVERFGYDLEAIEREAIGCTRRLHTCAYLWRRRDTFKHGRGA